VKVGSYLSGSKDIFTGVPQGSVLGPLLFNLYFNDITDINALVELALFADDISGWIAAKSCNTIEERLQQLLNEIQAWMSKWRLKLSVSKTQFTLFNRGSRHLKEKISLKYRNQVVKSERNPKFLGVYLDPGMTLNAYVNETKNRAIRRLNLLKTISGKNWGASPQLKLTAYKVLIRSILDYLPFGNLLLCNTSLLTIERIQRKAIKIALNLDYSTSTKVFYEKVKLDTIFNRSPKLTDKYLCKSIIFDPIIAHLVNHYNSTAVHAEGSYCKGMPRSTIFGILKQSKELNCAKIFL
jgi:hypothetical protein